MGRGVKAYKIKISADEGFANANLDGTHGRFSSEIAVLAGTSTQEEDAGPMLTPPSTKSPSLRRILASRSAQILAAAVAALFFLAVVVGLAVLLRPGRPRGEYREDEGTQDVYPAEHPAEIYPGERPVAGLSMRPIPLRTRPEELRSCAPAQRHTFYMYRAQDDADHPIQNVNTADAEGVLWYLQNEVVTMCPRKYNITRILRLKITMVPPLKVLASQFMFSPFVAFDHGQCTVPECDSHWQRFGYSVGCQQISPGSGYQGTWYSLPGPCPSAPRPEKTPQCADIAPGGSCQVVTGTDSCTYNIEPAGEVRIDELTGIADYRDFCEIGGMEYNKEMDRGVRMSFWDSIGDVRMCQARVGALRDLFRRKFPDLPELEDDRRCDYCDIF